MSEKRFIYKNNKVYDNLTGEFHSSNMVSVNVLNNLHQENQSLKFELDECANNKLYSRRKLEEENEQLRQTVQHSEEEYGVMKKDLTIVHRKNKELQIENLELNHMNEQLKQDLENYSDANGTLEAEIIKL